MKSASLNLLSQLLDVFKSNGWSIDFDDPEKSKFKGRFERLFALFQAVEDEKTRNMLFKLLSQYVFHPWTQYPPLLEEALCGIKIDSLSNIRRTYIVPGLSDSDERRHRSKSSNLIVEMCKHMEDVPILTLSRNPVLLTQIKELSNLNLDNSLILVVDDFVGSGKTISEAVDRVRETASTGSAVIIVACMAIMADGMLLLLENEIDVYAARVYEKGISDSDLFEDKEGALKLMIGLEESILKIRDDFSLGFGKSESLVTMLRTPNNTFPVFWQDNRPNGKKSAPFPRYK